MVQNLKKVLKSKISKKNSFLRHEVPFKAKNNREAVVVCAIHVVKRPSKRSVLVCYTKHLAIMPIFHKFAITFVNIEKCQHFIAASVRTDKTTLEI